MMIFQIILTITAYLRRFLNFFTVNDYQ